MALHTHKHITLMHTSHTHKYMYIYTRVSSTVSPFDRESGENGAVCEHQENPRGE